MAHTTDTGSIDNIGARLALADAIIEAVKASGLLRPKRRRTTMKQKRRATARKAAAKPRTRRALNPLTKVPDENAA